MALIEYLPASENRMFTVRKIAITIYLSWLVVGPSFADAKNSPLAREARAAMKRAAIYFHRQVATRGGYVYFYSLDLKQRWGEGPAPKSQIWVQPPATPTVGLAFLKAYQATGEKLYLDAATDAARALVYGQLKSGGWTNNVDFDPSRRAGEYRNGKSRGKNNSSLDDGQSQTAIQLLMQVDKSQRFQLAEIHESAEVALAALLSAQFPNGGFPQVWTGPVEKKQVLAANYPSYDWKSAGRIKNYWDMYTLNDNVCGYVADTLTDAFEIYEDQRFYDALRKLGDFLLLAQMPEPQPAWAQQYNYQMQPIWARRFEPPAISGDESQETIETLMKIFIVTGDQKYLTPIPSALKYLRRSVLSDGRLARYYELNTNQPLYMQRHGKNYELTYDDTNLPAHYGWKSESRLQELEREYRRLKSDRVRGRESLSKREIQRVVSSLDDLGRWVSTSDGSKLIGQTKFPKGDKYLSSEVFSSNLSTLASFLQSEHEGNRN